MNKYKKTEQNFWGKLRTKILRTDAEIFASEQFTKNAKHAKYCSFIMFFRIHAKIDEINFDVSTPSVGTI
jgi:hypothetical protein